MWTISMLKENAKRMLSGYYWVALAASLIFAVLAGGLLNQYKGENKNDALSDNLTDYISNSSGITQDSEELDDIMEKIKEFNAGTPSAAESEQFAQEIAEALEEIGTPDDLMRILKTVIAIVAVFVLIAVIISFLYTILFANPLMVGHFRFYLDARAGNASVGNLFSQFRTGVFGNTVKTTFIRDFKLWLWGLLGIIPVVFTVILCTGSVQTMSGKMDSFDDFLSGAMEMLGFIILGLIAYYIFLIPKIIKTLSYTLVPFIVAENPSITTKRAFDISVNTMKGEKLHYFGLQLSFIGWYVLCSVAGSLVTGVIGQGLGSIVTMAGLVFLYPYVYATYAEFYCCMREKALAQGFAYPDELNGVFGKANNIPFPEQGYTGAPYQPTDSGSVNASGSYPAPSQPEKKVDFEPVFGHGEMDEISHLPKPEPLPDEKKDEDQGSGGDDIFTKSDNNDNNNLW